MEAKNLYTPCDDWDGEWYSRDEILLYEPCCEKSKSTHLAISIADYEILMKGQQRLMLLEDGIKRLIKNLTYHAEEAHNLQIGSSLFPREEGIEIGLRKAIEAVNVFLGEKENK